jgi:spore germination protein
LRKLLLTLVTSISLIILGTGCAQERIVEELGFIHGVGYELNEAENADEDGILTITLSLPQVSPTAVTDRVTLTTTAHTSKEGRTQLARQTERVLVSGQLRTVLFSDNLAERGFKDTIDTLNRDHSIGLNLKVIVVNGSAKELLMGEYEQHPRTSRYIYEMVEKEAKTHVTIDTSLYQFIRDYYDDGIDPIVPLIKQGKKEIILDGIGLFKGDQLVIKVHPKDGRVFKMLHGDYLGGNITVEMDLKDEPKEDDYLYLTFNTLESTRKVNVKSPSEIEIDLHVKGGVDEYTGHLDLSDDEVQMEIEEKLGKYIEEIGQKIISEMQEKQSDSLGLGQFVRNSSSYQKWKGMNWKEEIYPDAKISVNVDVKLKGFGSVK